jgi:hypothetical protein
MAALCEEGGCGVEAVGWVQAPSADWPALRQNPGRLPGRSGTSSALRHAEDQTILGLAAMLKALEQRYGDQPPNPDWGVVAAPCFLGRLGAATFMERFRRQGCIGISPQNIPNLSLHAMSGTLTMLLGIHGPNFGVGGAHGNVAEGLLAALALQSEPSCPGVWLVLTECRPEPIPDLQGRNIATNAVGHAVAFGLSASPAVQLGLEFRLRMEGPSGPPVTVADLVGFLSDPGGGGSRHWECPLPGGGRIELVDRRAGLARQAG